MKAIRMILVITVVMVSVLGLYASETRAAAALYTCTVIETGVTPTSATVKYRFKLTDDGAAFANKYFALAAGMEKEMLAIALTAQANGKKVKIYTDLAAATPTITQIYLLNF